MEIYLAFENCGANTNDVEKITKIFETNAEFYQFRKFYISREDYGTDDRYRIKMQYRTYDKNKIRLINEFMRLDVKSKIIVVSSIVELNCAEASRKYCDWINDLPVADGYTIVYA